MATSERTVLSSRTEALAAERSKVLRNTYMLLSMTLFGSAVAAFISMQLAMPPMTYLICAISALLLIWFVMPRVADSSAGIGMVFVITGLLGFGLGPILSNYLALPNGAQVIGTALGGTGVIFLALSGYALMTRRDFSFMGGFLMAGVLAVIVLALANIFLGIPALSLAISAVVILIMSGFILYDTSRIIHGGETNYVMATIGMYMSIFNIFISLLQILGFAGGDD